MNKNLWKWAGVMGILAVVISLWAADGTVSINGNRVLRAPLNGSSGTAGQILVLGTNGQYWATSPLPVGGVNQYGSVTWYGSTLDVGFTITNGANGNYRWSLPASGLSGAYNFNFSGTNVTLVAASAGNWTALGTTNNSALGDTYQNASYSTNGVNNQGAGDGVLVLTNAARTFTAAWQPHGTMTANVTLLSPAAGFSGFPYWGNSAGTMTPVASTNTGTGPEIVLKNSPTIVTPTVTTSLNFNGDTPVERESAAVVQLGTDAAAATAQTLKTADGSGTDKVGAAFTVAGGQSTGTGRGGSMLVKTSPSSTTGASANAYSERFHATAKHVVLTEATATTIMNIACAAGKWVGGQFTCTINADDGTNFQALTSEIRFSAVNKAGTITAAITPTDGTAVPSIVAVSSGTLTPVTYSIVVNGNSVDIKVAATSSLTQTTLNATYVITALNSNTTAAVTEQ